MALEITDANLNEVLSTNELAVVDFCYCGEPVNLINPDCIEFKLCKKHADDA